MSLRIASRPDANPFVLEGARHARSSFEAISQCRIRILDGKICFADSMKSIAANEIGIDLSGYLILPGFINAHDHLQYALHPKIGRPPYSNYVQWGEDIHRSLQDEISRYNAVPLKIRLWWGAIRNLLCGVTTVGHHNTLWPMLISSDYPVKVLRRYGWAHSTRLEKDIHNAWKSTPHNGKFFIHACEGTDEQSRLEIFEINTLGMLNSNTVLVHGLALDEPGITLLKESQASLILCPSSNVYLYGELPPLSKLVSLENSALGNDSPISACGDLLDEVRYVAEWSNISTDVLYRMITECPASIMQLDQGEGAIREDACADLIAVRDDGKLPHEKLKNLSWRDIELVMVNGEIKAASDHFVSQLPGSIVASMEPLAIEDHLRWIRAPIQYLTREAEIYLGAGKVTLNGRTIRHVNNIDETLAASRAN